MTSEPHQTTTASATRAADLSHDALRLRLKPVAPQRGHVDGAWWPRSRDLSAELPSLIKALSDRIGVVDRVVYASTFWSSAPNRVEVAGHTVALERLAALDTDVVHIGGDDRRRIDLLVVPPEAFGAAADRAMAGGVVAGQRPPARGHPGHRGRARRSPREPPMTRTTGAHAAHHRPDR